MNTLKLSLLDSVVLSAADYAAPAAPAARAEAASPAARPAVLWRQSLSAHEPAAHVRWATRGSFTVLGALSLASIVYAATALFHCVASNGGLQAGVRSLMGH